MLVNQKIIIIIASCVTIVAVRGSERGLLLREWPDGMDFGFHISDPDSSHSGRRNFD